MKKILIIGYYGTNTDPFGGQQIKTKQITEALANHYKLCVIDTTSWKKKKFLLAINFLVRLLQYKKIVILPAHNGTELFFKVFKTINLFLKKDIYYMVIGGWLPDLLNKKRQYLSSAKLYSKIFVETVTMKRKMNNLGLFNIQIMRNFKDFIPATYEQYETNGMYKFCFFSRIVEQKGILEAIDAIIIVTEKYKIKCTLDIYGNISNEFKELFLSKISLYPDIVAYKGVVDNRSSIQILKNYYMQIFPTKYYTEGIPGSIIDSYFSGLPVIASRWESSSDIILDGVTGLIFNFLDFQDLVDKIYYSVNNEELIISMRKNCLSESAKYSKKSVIDGVMKVIDNEKY